jgi:hypothetical protein
VVIDAILAWWFDLVRTFIDGFPATEDPSNPLNFDLSMMDDMNYFLPLSEMFGVFVAFVALGGPFVGTSLIIWVVVGILRGGSTKA